MPTLNDPNDNGSMYSQDSNNPFLPTVTSTSPTLSPSLTPKSSSSSKIPLVSYATSDSESEEKSVAHHPFSPSPTKAPLKRSHAEQPMSTPQDGLLKKKWKMFQETKEKVVGTTTGALNANGEGSDLKKKGLLKFFCKETAEECEQRMKREKIESDLRQQKVAEEAVLKERQEATVKEKERLLL